MLSGIGPAEDLQSLGIPVKVELDGVGQNLQDHASALISYSSKVSRMPGCSLVHFYKKSFGGLLLSEVDEETCLRCLRGEFLFFTMPQDPMNDKKKNRVFYSEATGKSLRNLAQYFVLGGGPLTSNMCEV